MLPRLPVVVAIRLVQSRIEARVFLAVLPDLRSRLHLDIHRCKGKANLHSAQTDMYHTPYRHTRGETHEGIYLHKGKKMIFR